MTEKNVCAAVQTNLRLMILTPLIVHHNQFLFSLQDLSNKRNTECELSFLIGDGVCDDTVNNWKCNFDNGDCCQTIMIKSNCLMCLCYKTLGVSTVEVANVTDTAISDE